MAPTPDPSTPMAYVNKGQAWSIGLPDGWTVERDDASGAILLADDAFAEILLAPASGLTPRQHEAKRLAEFTTWPGAGEIESDVVSLPAGKAIRLIFKTAPGPNAAPSWFIFYVFEEGDTQYVMSVRGPTDNEDVPAVAEALAESFAILD
jgi:hypothetical protein